jgi:hypothetical protein
MDVRETIEYLSERVQIAILGSAMASVFDSRKQEG